MSCFEPGLAHGHEPCRVVWDDTPVSFVARPRRGSRGESSREQVLRAVDQGKPRREIVSMFGVSLAKLKRYLKQRREAGDALPKPISGRPSKKYVPLKADLMAQLEAHRDVTLEEHWCLWEAAHGMQVSTTTMSRAIRRVGWTRKKGSGCRLPATRKSGPPGERK
jgi:transposase